MENERITAYIVAIIDDFALKHGLPPQQAFQYLDAHQGIAFLEKHYEVEHTLSFENVVEDLTAFCHRMGGNLT